LTEVASKKPSRSCPFARRMLMMTTLTSISRKVAMRKSRWAAVFGHSDVRKRGMRAAGRGWSWSAPGGR
jgi:hypothetical protein